MNYIYKLETIEIKLEELSVLQKLELYLLPIIFCFAIFLLFPESENIKVKAMEQHIEKLQNKKLLKSYLDLTKEYGKYINDNGLVLENINIEENKISLNVKSSLYKILKFLFYIELNTEFSSFSSFKLIKTNGFYSLYLYIDYEHFYFKNQKIDIDKRLAFLNKKSLIIDAYIDDYILIDDKWLKIGDEINRKKLINVDNNYAYFQTKDKKIIKVIKNEKSK